jgi:predicted acetyltransferase
MRNSAERYKMYAAYMRHIQSLMGELFDGGRCMRQFEKLDESWHDVQWVPVKLKTKEVGFFTVYQAPNCHPDTNYYIEDSFVIPEARNQGLMQKAIQKFVKDNPGKYCLFILDNNEPAKHMWNAVFEGLGYQPLELCQVMPQKDGITQYGWGPKGEAN